MLVLAFALAALTLDQDPAPAAGAVTLLSVS